MEKIDSVALAMDESLVAEDTNYETLQKIVEESKAHRFHLV